MLPFQAFRRLWAALLLIIHWWLVLTYLVTHIRKRKHIAVLQVSERQSCGLGSGQWRSMGPQGHFQPLQYTRPGFCYAHADPDCCCLCLWCGVASMALAWQRGTVILVSENVAWLIITACYVSREWAVTRPAGYPLYDASPFVNLASAIWPGTTHTASSTARAIKRRAQCVFLNI